MKVLPAFIATAFLLALVPGQTVAMILRQAIVGGTKTAYTTVIGTSTALVFWGGHRLLAYLKSLLDLIRLIRC